MKTNIIYHRIMADVKQKHTTQKKLNIKYIDK